MQHGGRIRSFAVGATLLCACTKEPVSAGITPKLAQDFGQARVAESNRSSVDYRSHVYAQRPTGPLELFVFSPSDRPGRMPSAAVLLFHSGGWTRGRPEWLFGLAKQFSTLGLVGVPVRYRLSKDGVTPIDAIADACSAFRWVREHAAELGVDPERVAGWGASAGGQLIASGATAGCNDQPHAAVSGAANALVLVSAGVDSEGSAQFKKLVGDASAVTRHSPLANVRPGVPPMLIVAGSEDSVTSLASAELFCSKVRAVGSTCELLAFPKRGHLLTRKLDDQRNELDPDPAAEREAYAAEERFLRKLGFIPHGS